MFVQCKLVYLPQSAAASIASSSSLDSIFVYRLLGARLCPSGDIQPVDRNQPQILFPVSGTSIWRQKPARVTSP